MNIKKIFFALLCFALPASAAAPAAAGGIDTTDRTELLGETSRPLTEAEARAFFPRQGYNDDKPLVIPAILIIMAGAKVWNVIVDNRPTADLASAYASAIPGFDFTWADLQDWRKVTKLYRYTIDTTLQGRAVDITYEVTFYHGAISTPGTDGLKGHYLANFTVKPVDIKLKWGWKVALEVSMSDPMNIGTAAEPIAWLNADLKWRYAKPLSTDPKIGLTSLTVDGQGKLAEAEYKGPHLRPGPEAEPAPELPAVNWY